MIKSSVVLKQLLPAMLLTAWFMPAFAADPILGEWRNIDDRTGFSKGIINIVLEKDGTYSGTITRVIPRPNYKPVILCQHCPAPYTGKVIVGLKVLTNLRNDPKQPGRYYGGRILDPLNGNLYSAKAHISSDNRRLNMRGFVGVSVLGRTQTWIREDSFKESIKDAPETEVTKDKHE